MRIFVAGWFFPPSTSSEGIVTYKLLRNSKFQYDVVCSNSDQWGYKDRIDVKADNINVISIATDDLNVWKKKAIKKFSELYEVHKYEYFMTRAMPNESLEVGLEIKNKYPSVKWICSLADPVANNPYVLKAIKEIPDLSEAAKSQIVRELSMPKNQWTQEWLLHPSNSVRDQFYWKDIQDQALLKCDCLVTTSLEQGKYIDNDRVALQKLLVIPHSYDRELFDHAKTEREWEKDKIHFTYTGYADNIRSLDPFVEAVKWISDRYPQLLNSFKFHFFGNYPRETVDRAFAYQIKDCFDFSGNVSYYETLAIMKKSDWLLHVDGYFDELAETGGSIFFAGKLADYIGSNRPIFALTGQNSPAGNIIDQYGGVVVSSKKIPEIAQKIVNILFNKSIGSINEGFATFYDAKIIGETFDDFILSGRKKTAPANDVIVLGETNGSKALTVCVPSFNAEKVLRRALDSLLDIANRDFLEVIIVDDGSSDSTFEIGKEYVGRYPKSVRIISKPNGGHGSGINYGMRYASGKYFRVVDSDDWVDSAALDSEVEYIKSKTNDPDIIYTPYHIVDQATGNSEKWPLSSTIEFNRLYSFKDLIKSVGVNNVYFTMAGTSFKTSILNEMGLELMERTFYADSLFILKPIKYVNNVVFLPNYVYKYLRGQSEQSVAPQSFVKHYADHEKVVKDLIVYEQSTEMSAEHRKYLTHIIRMHLNTNYQILLEFNRDLAKGLIKAKSFDEWLKSNAKSYSEWVGQTNPYVKAIRLSHYKVENFDKFRKTRRSKKKNDGKSLIRTIAHSSLIMNKMTMKFIRKQKDNNGPIYRIYMILKGR